MDPEGFFFRTKSFQDISVLALIVCSLKSEQHRQYGGTLLGKLNIGLAGETKLKHVI